MESKQLTVFVLSLLAFVAAEEWVEEIWLIAPGGSFLDFVAADKWVDKMWQTAPAGSLLEFAVEKRKEEV